MGLGGKYKKNTLTHNNLCTYKYTHCIATYYVHELFGFYAWHILQNVCVKTIVCASLGYTCGVYMCVLWQRSSKDTCHFQQHSQETDKDRYVCNVEAKP